MRESGDTVYSVTHYSFTVNWCYINSPTLEMEKNNKSFYILYYSSIRLSLGPAPHWASFQAAKNGGITRYMVAASSLLQ
jgi:hypothetical protein